MKRKIFNKLVVLLVSILSISATKTAMAQPFYGWTAASTTNVSNSNPMNGRSVATDAAGNVYTIGEFVGTVDFNPGAGTFNLTSAGNLDIFIQKLDASGNFLWAKRIGNTGEDAGYGIALDANGNVYTTGEFAATVDFDPNSGSANLTAAGGIDIFVSKLDASGNYIWAKRMGGIDNDFSFDIALDASGNVYTTGFFLSTADFDPGTSTANLTSAGARDIFISKLDAAGNYVWAKRLGGTSDDSAYDIALDASSNIYTTGRFTVTADFDPSSGTANLTSAGGGDIFISKLDATGNYVWAKRIGNTGTDIGNSLAVDLLGNVIVSGSFASTVDFDPSTATTNLTSAGSNDVFIVKLNAAGNYIWAKRMGGSFDDVGRSIAVDASGNVYTTGYFSGTTDFNPNAGVANLTSAGDIDIFIQKLSFIGDYVWALRMGGSFVDMGNGIAISSSNNIHTTGFIEGTVNMNPLGGTDNKTGISLGIFTQKLLQSPPCTTTSGTINASICQGNSYIFNSVARTTAGVYLDTLVNAGGCDSILSLNLTVNPLSTPITTVPIAASVCPNTNTTLNASGGTNGSGAVINWYSGPNGTGSFLGTGSSIVVSPNATSTYYVRREGTCNNSDDYNVVVNVKTFVYAADGTSTNNYCTDNNGWNHFYTGNEIIFSVQGDLSSASAGFPIATISKNGSFYQSTDLSGSVGCSCGIPQGDERFEMARSWNLNMGGGTSVPPYNVRFYYPPSEKTAIETAAANWIAANPSCGFTYKYPVPLGFYWFKNTGSDYTAPLYDGTHVAASPGTTVNGINYSQWTGITSFSGGSGAVIVTPNVSTPVAPTIACYETATFNTTTCMWDVTGTQPAMPTLACYETATFNTTTCMWDVTGTQPAMPTLACYETATFNGQTCMWDVTGTQPAMPTLACYETATFNTTTCMWDVTGTQPAMPTLACYETATFNTTTCMWDVTGTQPAMPTLACYETATFNTTTCMWDVTGTQPAMPTLACYETATFNTTTCMWDVTGTQPAMPTLACYETATFNTTTCMWDVTGTQPAMPTLACYETASFNTTTCMWDVTGTQPAMPTLACYETATFNTTTCMWDVTGTPNPVITSTTSSCVNYTWAINGVTYNQSGTYAYSSNCQDYELVLTINPLPVVTATNVSACFGSSVVLGGSPAGGTWDLPNPYSGSATSYNYFYTDANGCSNTASGLIFGTLASISSVNISAVTGISANVNYSAVSGIGWYEIRYKLTSSSTWTVVTNSVATTKPLINLTPNANYEVQVRGFCSTTAPGLWSSTVLFTTNNVCGVPTGLFTTSVAGTTATLNWSNTGASFYTIRWKKLSSSTWTNSSTSTTTSKSIAGLSVATQYEFQVRSHCGSSIGAFSASGMFTTGPSAKGTESQIAALASQISIYPNPTKGDVTISLTSDISNLTSIKLVDMSGRVVNQVQVESALGAREIKMNISDLSNGVYSLQLMDNDQLISVERLIKD